MLPKLPPTLHNLIFKSGPNYSKAPRGLFVQVWEGRIFTAIAISPSLSSRQSLSRSTFRAGLNSPVKEFRYHRTVIVTAAVHQGFNPELVRRLAESQRILTYWHWAGVTPYTSSFDFAESCVFVKQSLSVICCNHLSCDKWQDISQSYVQLFCRVP